MASRSGFPEFVVGGISLFIFCWMWTPIYNVQQLTSKLDASVSGNTSLILQGASCILLIGLFGIIGLYSALVCCERCVIFSLERKNRDKNAAEEPMKRVDDYIGELQTSSEVIHTKRK